MQKELGTESTANTSISIPAVKISIADLFRAYGFFECTNDCTDITSASFLNTVGKKTEVLLRISTVGPESGSADTARDVHGWGMKLYTDEGNLDWVFNNTVRCPGPSPLTAGSDTIHSLLSSSVTR